MKQKSVTIKAAWIGGIFIIIAAIIYGIFGLFNNKSDNQIEVNPITKIDKIENLGNLNIGQTGGTVNQNTIITPKPLPRHMTEKEVFLILNSIPSDYTVNVNHPIDKESINFALEILNILNQSGYKTTSTTYGLTIPDLNQSFNIKVNNSDSTAEIIVYRLK